MTSKERRGFTYKNYHSRIEFTKESSYYSIKRQKKRLTIPHNQINWKILEPSKTKEYYQSHSKNNNS